MSLERAEELGCNCLQIFSRNPRGWNYKPIDTEEVARFRELKKTTGIGPVAIHTSYLINLSSLDDALFKKSIALFNNELVNARALGVEFLVTHLGSSKSTKAEGIKRSIKALKEVAKVKGPKKKDDVTILLENTADGGMQTGGELGHIGEVIDAIDKVGGKSGGLNLGLCFDTCHAFAAGHPMKTKADADKLVRAIDGGVGIKRLGLIHLNDSKGDLGSKIDRHDHIGKGKIGSAGLKAFLTQAKIKNIPLVLETPTDDNGDDTYNLRKVKSLLK